MPRRVTLPSTTDILASHTACAASVMRVAAADVQRSSLSKSTRSATGEKSENDPPPDQGARDGACPREGSRPPLPLLDPAPQRTDGTGVAATASSSKHIAASAFNPESARHAASVGAFWRCGGVAPSDGSHAQPGAAGSNCTGTLKISVPVAQRAPGFCCRPGRPHRRRPHAAAVARPPALEVEAVRVALGVRAAGDVELEEVERAGGHREDRRGSWAIELGWQLRLAAAPTRCRGFSLTKSSSRGGVVNRRDAASITYRRRPQRQTRTSSRREMRLKIAPTNSLSCRNVASCLALVCYCGVVYNPL